MGRRTRKHVETGNGAGVYATNSDRRFIYDGWNLTVEIDALQLENAGQSLSFKTEKAFTWGLDLSGTTQGAGGVGGLLMQIYPWAGGFSHPLYDAMGNVHGMVDENANIIAAWGYSATGEIVQQAGWSGGGWSPFRFASKFYDEETGLYQYNHRYYSPSQGRFISRDPIAENGGLNLYAYCGNDPVGHYDYLGMFLGKLFKKAFKWVKNNWRSIVGVVLNFIPVVGQALSMAWNAGVGLKYGGIRGMLTSLAGAGAFGGVARFAATADGLYRGFRQGKFLHNLSNYVANHAASSIVGSVASGRTPQWTDTFSSIGGQFRSLRLGAIGAASRLGIIPERSGSVDMSGLQVVGIEESGASRAEQFIASLQSGTGYGNSYYSFSRPADLSPLANPSNWVAAGQGSGAWTAAYRHLNHEAGWRNNWIVGGQLLAIGGGGAALYGTGALAGFVATGGSTTSLSAGSYAALGSTIMPTATVTGMASVAAPGLARISNTVSTTLQPVMAQAPALWNGARDFVQNLIDPNKGLPTPTRGGIGGWATNEFRWETHWSSKSRTVRLRNITPDQWLGALLVLLGTIAAVRGYAFAKGLIQVSGVHIRVIGVATAVYGVVLIVKGRSKL